METLPILTPSLKKCPEIFMDKSFVVVVQGGLAASCRLWQKKFLYYLLSTRRNTKNKSFYLPWMRGMLIACETARFDLDVCHAEGNM